MITNFEDLTNKLTPDELSASVRVHQLLSNRPNTFFKNKAIRLQTTAVFDNDGKRIKLTPVRIRKIINFLHVSGYAPRLFATSKGYKFHGTKDELVSYAVSLNERIEAIQERLNAVEVSLHHIKSE